jgi:hypothetical protein
LIDITFSDGAVLQCWHRNRIHFKSNGAILSAAKKGSLDMTLKINSKNTAKNVKMRSFGADLLKKSGEEEEIEVDAFDMHSAISILLTDKNVSRVLAIEELSGSVA